MYIVNPRHAYDLADPFDDGLGQYGQTGTLQKFSPSELLLDEADTRAVLRYFWPDKARQIDSAPVTDEMRGFAQGLIVEATDASLTMAITKTIFERFFMRRTRSLKSIAKSAGKVIQQAWRSQRMRNKQINLDLVMIYDSVRVTLARNFRTELELMLMGVEL
jgi:hypothetical protein